jgi:superfamily II DNA or RNA helicase
MTSYDDHKHSKYIDLKINGRLFPSWLVANFKNYDLPKIVKQEGVDPCNVSDTSSKEYRNELKKYQIFVSKYLDYRSPFKNILLFYGVGAGKTGTTINIYNALYEYTPGWNVFLLIKASLKETWLVELKKWLKKDQYDYRFRNIIFINYDSPFADKSFMDAIKNVDNSKKSLYIIEEAHNFIRNVYSNVTSDKGKRAQNIYDYIVQDQKENPDTRVIALTATPVVNTPFELALLFNLLRPGIFPKSENEFTHLFVSSGSFKTINKNNKNLFQRRIMGLVSYYIGATPDLYAAKQIHYLDVPMSDNQEDIYGYFEEIEDKIAMKMKFTGKTSQIYKSYTRQACNFVFPALNQKVNGENRPRPGKFKLSEREALKLSEGKSLKSTDKKTLTHISEYEKTLKLYTNSFEQYLKKINEEDKDKKYTIENDLDTYMKKYNGDYEKFFKEEKQKSELFKAIHISSPKMTYIIFNIHKSKGPVIVYSNYVLMEGIELFKIYLKMFGYYGYMETKKIIEDKVGFVEFHGGIKDFKERADGMRVYNQYENRYGKFIKIILISPAGSEGLSLRNVRQIHIMEPYWNEVRITQMIGRGIRLCSHSDLSIDERHVDVYRYKSKRTKINKWTTDEYIEDLARSKETLIQSFLDAVKEVAVDCVLNKNHNMISQEYKCFQFEERSQFDKHIGPAYKPDLYDDIKYNNGSNSTNSTTIKVKVMKIKAVIKLSKDDEKPRYSSSDFYWMKSNIVYDYKFHYPYGKIEIDDQGIPIKFDKDTYIINYVVPIPIMSE